LQAEQANLHRLISEVSEKLNALLLQNASVNSQVEATSKLLIESNSSETP